MAIQFVGGKSGNFVGATSGNTNVALTSGLTGGLEASARPGDLIVVAYSVGSGSNRDASLSISDGTTAYTLAGSELFANGTTYEANLRVAYKFMAYGVDPNVVLGPTGNAADGGSYAVLVFRGVDPRSILDGSVQTATGSGTGRPDPPSITPTVPGAVIVLAGAGAAATGANFTAGYLSGFNTRNGADTNDGTVGMGYLDWTSGAYNGAQWTGGSTNAANAWCAVALALRPLAELTPVTGAPKVESTTYLAGFGTSITLQTPAGVTDGDMLLMAVTSYNDVVPATPSGWTLFDSYASAMGAVAWFWRVASGQGGTQVVASGNGSPDDLWGIFMRITGADTASPFETDLEEASGTGTARSSGDITTTVDKALLLCHYDGSEELPVPSGYAYLPTGNGESGIFEKVVTTAGVDGAQSATTASDTWSYYTIAIKPYVEPPPTEGYGSVPVLSGWQDAVNTGFNITVNKPTGVVSGDPMLAFVSVYMANAATDTIAATGWTVIGSFITGTENVDGTSKSRMWVLMKVAGGSEPSTYQFDNTTSTYMTVMVARAVGLNQTDPLELATDEQIGIGATRNANAITTVHDNSLAVIFSTGWNQAATASPSGYTDAHGVDIVNHLYTKAMATPGSTGSGNHTQAGSDGYHTGTLALRATYTPPVGKALPPIDYTRMAFRHMMVR